MLKVFLPSTIAKLSSVVLITSFFCLAVQAAETAQPKSLQIGVNLQVRAYLQGAYNASNGLMQDALRTKGLIPLQQPYRTAPFSYAGTETLNRSLTSVSIGGDGDALIDWVLVELRDAANPGLIRAQKALGLQADGDVMDVQTGSTSLAFLNVSPANYYVALRHRNHLTVISTSPQALSFTSTLIDFTQPIFATARQTRFSLDKAKGLLWAGDITQDKRVVGVGVGNDNNAILTAVLRASANTAFNSSYKLTGYAATDLNLDGETLAVGPGNDSNLIYTNVLTHPSNSSFASNYIVLGSGY